MSSNHACVVTEAHELRFEEHAFPACPDGSVVIKAAAVGLNRHDVLSLKSAAAGQVLGLEVAGVVVSGPAHLHGKRVAALVPHGAFAEHVAAVASHCVVLPDSLSFAQGAAVVESFATAVLALELADVPLRNAQAPKRVLVHAGASALGLALIQLLKIAGHFVVTTAGSDEKLAVCQTHGAAVALNRNGPWAELLLSQHGGKVDAIIDCVGADYYARNTSVLAVDGTLVFLGLLGGATVPNVDLRTHLLARHQLKFSVLSTRSPAFKSALIERMWSHCQPLLASGALQVVLHETSVPLRDAKRAVDICAANLNIGKIVMTVD